MRQMCVEPCRSALPRALGPGIGLRVVYRYKLHTADGSDAGEAHYAVMVEPGETIRTGDGRMLRVLDVVPVLENDSAFVGLLQVEPA